MKYKNRKLLIICGACAAAAVILICIIVHMLTGRAEYALIYQNGFNDPSAGS